MFPLELFWVIAAVLWFITVATVWKIAFQELCFAFPPTYASMLKSVFAYTRESVFFRRTYSSRCISRLLLIELSLEGNAMPCHADWRSAPRAKPRTSATLSTEEQISQSIYLEHHRSGGNPWDQDQLFPLELFIPDCQEECEAFSSYIIHVRGRGAPGRRYAN